MSMDIFYLSPYVVMHKKTIGDFSTGY